MDLNKISQNTIDRYSKRYNDFGKDIKTLGWGSIEQQVYRFGNTIGATEFSNKRILDIGCGFGDYHKFLESEKISAGSYERWDINADLINEANMAKGENQQFSVFNLAKDDITPKKNNWDIAVMLGLLNFNLGSEEINHAYTKIMIEKAFSLVREVLVVDFLSSRLFHGYPKEDFVFYHDPCWVLETCLNLSADIVLKHDYAPIPQKEFMIYLYKQQ